MIIPNREELAWAAGFFDGEGCTTTSQVKYNYISMTISQNDRETLLRFQNAIGGLGTVKGPYQHKRLSKNLYYRWQVYKFEHTQAVMAMLWGFLSEPKRKQYKRCLDKVRQNPMWQVSRSMIATRMHARHRSEGKPHWNQKSHD